LSCIVRLWFIVCRLIVMIITLIYIYYILFNII
jgi:hypothetical protein